MSTRIGGIDVGNEQTRRALWDSTWDGIFATVMIGLVDTFGVGGAVALGVPSVPIALLGSLPVWLGTLAQLGLRRRLAGQRRKPWVVTAVRIQGTVLLVLALTGWAPAAWAPWLYAGGFVVYGASNAAVGHLWMSWYADVCPEAVVGRMMAWRSTLFACVQLVTTVTAGCLSRPFNSDTAPWVLYAGVFAVAGLARHASAAFLHRQYEPFPAEQPALARSFEPTVALRRFARAVAALHGAALMAGPFFAVWFLRDLRWNYLTFAVAAASTVAGQLVANSFVGRLVDKLGAARVLLGSAAAAAIVPIPYVLCEDHRVLWLANFYSGIAWASVNVAAFKYLAQVSRGIPHRSGFVYANVWLTSSVVAMSLVGGFLAPRLPTVFAWPLQTLFFASCCLRIVIVLALFTRLIDLEPTDALRRWKPGRLFQIFRWSGPGTTHL
jgi:MFS family permease